MTRTRPDPRLVEMPDPPPLRPGERLVLAWPARSTGDAVIEWTIPASGTGEAHLVRGGSRTPIPGMRGMVAWDRDPETGIHVVEVHADGAALLSASLRFKEKSPHALYAATTAFRSLKVPGGRYGVVGATIEAG